MKCSVCNYVTKTSYLPSDLNALDRASGTSCLAVNCLMNARVCALRWRARTDMGKQRPLAACARDQNAFKILAKTLGVTEGRKDHQYCSLENQSDIFIRDRDSAYDPLRFAENCGHILIMLIASLLKM